MVPPSPGCHPLPPRTGREVCPPPALRQPSACGRHRFRYGCLISLPHSFERPTAVGRAPAVAVAVVRRGARRRPRRVDAVRRAGRGVTVVPAFVHAPPRASRRPTPRLNTILNQLDRPLLFPVSISGQVPLARNVRSRVGCRAWLGVGIT